MHRIFRVVLGLAAALLAACGGGGGSDSGTAVDPAAPSNPGPVIVVGTQVPSNVNWQPPAGATPNSGNYLYVESEAGDPVGQGKTRLYTAAESVLTYLYANGTYGLAVANPELQWTGEFAHLGEPRAGLYGGAVPLEQRTALQPGMSWRTTGTRCGVPDKSWYVIDEVVNNGSGVERLVIRFSQSCDGGRTSLRGKMRWSRVDESGPRIAVPPSGLWQPPPDALPSSGSYAYFESAAGDYVGGGQKRLFTQATAMLDAYYVNAMAGAGYSLVVVSPDETWASPIATSDARALKPGYYPGLDRRGYGYSPAAMEWARNGRACGRQNGWLLIESVSFLGDLLVGLELRFEQRCGLSQAPLRGKVKWSAFDFLLPSGPAVPPPTNLWRAPAGATPATGSYVYLQSTAGDPVGQGLTQIYQGAGAPVVVLPAMGGLQMRVASQPAWALEFQAMQTVVALQPGHYLAASAWPAGDRRLAALSVTRDGQGCPAGDSEKWLAVDRVDRDAAQVVVAVEFRFGQRCASSSSWLYGQVKWDATQPQGLPITAATQGLWQPPAQAVPASGNYLYVEGDYEDVHTSGRRTLFTERDAVILAGDSGAPTTFGMSVLDGAQNWALVFRGVPEQQQLRPGLYANHGGRALDIKASAWSCEGQSESWFQVDNVAYDAGGVAAIELRFEHACPPGYGSSRGKLRWARSERMNPPGPVWPVPASQWRPPADALPSTGNYLYLQSEYGDTLGLGLTQLFTDTYARVSAFPSTAAFGLWVEDRTSTASWHVDIAPMQGLSRLELGLYADVGQLRSSKPAKGGLMLLAPNSFCNTIDGWFAVDEVSYSGDVMDAITVRFEQHCDKRSGPLRGQFKWRR